MKKHYLMLKTHNKTGLKYLCKKTTDDVDKCFSYKGSGTYWKKHLRIHGSDISTCILEVCETKHQLKERGIYYSNKLNVVDSEEYANLVIESGDGGATMIGRSITPEQNQRKKIALNKFHSQTSSKYKKVRNIINSLSHSISEGVIYITPKGEFISCAAAGIANNLVNSSIKKHCVDGNKNKIIDSRRMGKMLFLRKTWREVGYNTRPMTRSETIFYNIKLQIYKNILTRL